MPELNRLASAAQYPVADLSCDDTEDSGKLNVVDIKRSRVGRNAAEHEADAVDVAIQASRLRYSADYVWHLSTYVGATLPWH